MPRQKHPVEEFTFEDSQSSNDPNLEKVLLDYYAAMEERKIHGKQLKFLQAAENKLSQEADMTSEAVRNCIQQLESLYAEFTLDHASSEDRIRTLWGQIHGLEEKYTATLEDLQKRRTASEREKEKQVSGLSKVLTACEDYGRIVEQMSV